MVGTGACPLPSGVVRCQVSLKPRVELAEIVPQAKQSCDLFCAKGRCEVGCQFGGGSQMRYQVMGMAQSVLGVRNFPWVDALPLTFI